MAGDIKLNNTDVERKRKFDNIAVTNIYEYNTFGV